MKLKIFMKLDLKNILYILLLFLFGFSINFVVANRGVFPIDTFLHYDSASRILDGSIPIRDFWIVHGLTLDYIQALFFKLFGINWISYIAHSSLLNALITISTYFFFTINKLKKEYALILSFSFSILAYPVSGTPFIDQHSIFFCLLSFYFFSFGIKKDYKYLFFIPLFFGLAFFSKPVPSAYLIFSFGIIYLLYLLIEKNLDTLKYIILGTIFFLISLFCFIKIQNIDLNLFLTQLFYYPISLGTERFSAFSFDLKKILSNYKYILLTIFAVTFLLRKNLKKIQLRETNITVISIIIFNFACIYHQLLTMNQNFIFFLIPINLSFLIIYLEKNFETDKLKKIVYLIFIFCLFTTAKYHYRFNIERKFHDLQNVDLSYFSLGNEISSSFPLLKWKTNSYQTPEEEIIIVKNFLQDIENTKNILVMTNYNFIYSIHKNVHTVSRTYDSISFPDKKNQYYNLFRKYFYDKIKYHNISEIYLFFPSNDKKFIVNRFIKEYFENNCLKFEKPDPNLIKVKINECKIDQ